MRYLIFLLVILALAIPRLVAAGEAAPATRPASGEDKRHEAYFHRTLVEAYETVGSRNPAWDADARKILQLAAERWSLPEADDDLNWQIVLLGERAVRAGCDDPAVLYSFLRSSLVLDNNVKGQTLGRLEIALRDCKYAPFIKFFALATLVDFANSPAGKEKVLQQAFEALPPLLAEADFPQTLTVTRCSELTAYGLKRDGDRKPMTDKFYKIISDSMPPTSPYPDLFLGSAYWKYSWDAPGVGAPAQPGSARQERHIAGVKALDRALTKDPHLAIASAKMVGTLLDSGFYGRDVDLYFKQAIANDPGCYEAYRYRMGTLNTGAPGSDERILEFGRICLATKQWRSRVPFLVLRAHRTVAGADADPAFYEAYPRAWPDVRELYEGYFAFDPKSITERVRYGLLALKLHHPEIARKQLDDLKPLESDPLLKHIIAIQQPPLVTALKKAESEPKAALSQ